MSKKNVIAADEEKRLRIERAMAGCESKDTLSRFNYHLDRCYQCRNNPFNLCEVGTSLINEQLNKLGWMIKS